MTKSHRLYLKKKDDKDHNLSEYMVHAANIVGFT